jgi:hypothetical protein
MQRLNCQCFCHSSRAQLQLIDNRQLTGQLPESSQKQGKSARKRSWGAWGRSMAKGIRILRRSKYTLTDLSLASLFDTTRYHGTTMQTVALILLAIAVYVVWQRLRDRWRHG